MDAPTTKADPETPERFTQALACLEAITDHFAEFGPWAEKTPRDLVEELNHHNGWAQVEGTLPEDEEFTLTQLQALSRRRLQALGESGWNHSHNESLIRHIDQLIDQAITAETELVRLAIITDPDCQSAYQRLLATLPPEEMVEENDPNYAMLQGFGGCITCAGGHPCQVRMDEDVSEILTAAELPRSEAVTCLDWMIREGYSSLTDDIAELAEAFALLRGQSAEPLALEPPSIRSSLSALAEEETTRLERPIDPLQSCRSRG